MVLVKLDIRFLSVFTFLLRINKILDLNREIDRKALHSLATLAI